ncbi:MAG: 6-carboxytetrahydropterin synthase [Myxococcales bacterium]|nr:6-carboxytetrahydropterin synthase [Myxococcales bacterium]
MPILLTRISHFCAAHACHRPGLSDLENHALYGNEARLHGHNFRLEVTVRGPVDPRSGMVIHLAALDRLVRDEIVDVLDHRRLDTDIPFFAERPATIENILLFAWERLSAALANCELHRLRLHQDDRTYYDYFGESAGGSRD